MVDIIKFAHAFVKWNKALFADNFDLDAKNYGLSDVYMLIVMTVLLEMLIMTSWWLCTL
jgi:hypothetical protein